MTTAEQKAQMLFGIPAAGPALSAAEMKAQLEAKKWRCVYPVYINKQKTIAEGRKIGAANCCERPTVQEIAEICAFLKLPFLIEPDKAYSRDFMQRGRVRVQIRKDGKPINADIPNRKRLLMYCGQKIPLLKSRQGGGQKAEQGGGAGAGGGAKAKDKGKGKKGKKR